MKTIKKYNVIIVDGEVKKKEAVTEKATRLSKAEPVEKVVMDTTALSLVKQGEAQLAQAKARKSNEDLVIWEEIENQADNSNDPKEKAKAKAKADAESKSEQAKADAKLKKENDDKAKAAADKKSKDDAAAKAKADAAAAAKKADDAKKPSGDTKASE